MKMDYYTCSTYSKPIALQEGEHRGEMRGTEDEEGEKKGRERKGMEKGYLPC